MRGQHHEGHMQWQARRGPRLTGLLGLKALLQYRHVHTAHGEGPGVV